MEDKIYCNTKYENEIHSAQEWTKFTASTDVQCAPTLLNLLKKALVQLQQELILKVGVASMIKTLFTVNLRKQLASAETLHNKVSLQS